MRGGTAGAQGDADGVIGSNVAENRCMTRQIRAACITTLLCWTFVLPAAAQTPDQGMTAAGFDIGAMFPDDAFEGTLTAGGYGEYYLAPRLSVRGLLEVAKPQADAVPDVHLRQIRLLFNAVYNWEFGAWHPYATAGAGAYFVRLVLDEGDDPDGETRGGINFGGGVEYFLSNMNSVKGEARWDLVSHPRGFPDASSFVLTIGLKHYF